MPPDADAQPDFIHYIFIFFAGMCAETAWPLLAW
jgi:hypothetical protein